MADESGEGRGDSRWARPGSRPREAPRAEPRSEASAWVRGPRERRMVEPVSGVPVPELPWEAPPEDSAGARREPSILPVAIGVSLLAVLACVPHWVAPTVALMVSLVGIPIAWGFRRISAGRRRIQYVVVVIALLLCATLAVVAPMLWLQAGVLQPLEVPGTD